jgi:hypothetical protein
MKTKLSISLLLILALCPMPHALCQVPQGFNYQAIARLTTGDPIINTTLPVRITIQADSLGTSIIWQELHSSVTTNGFGLLTLILGKGARQAVSTVATFSAIDWSVTPKFIKTEINYSGWKTMGVTRLWSVPYSSIAEGLGGPVKKLAVKGVTTLPDEALFEVKNKDGQTVFAVYNEGVRVYVSDGAKALKGGFAVGGFGTDKAESTKYLFVGKDSVRVYLDTNPLTKKLKGGFAVGGYDLTKGVTVQDYLDVNSDSVRIYIDSNPATKKLKGGFAVGGYDMAKGTNTNYMNVNTDTSGIVNPSQNRILWYPIKNAFLTGKVLIEKPDSVGTNSFASGYESKAKGMYSQALGYKAIARGDYSTAIGKNAISGQTNSFAFGEDAIANNIKAYALGYKSKATGQDAFAFGSEVIAKGRGSFSFGSIGIDSAGMNSNPTSSLGDYSFALGMGSQAFGQGSFAIGIGNSASGMFSMAFGYHTTASGYASVAMGYRTISTGQYSLAMGINNTSAGYSSVALGSYANAKAFASLVIGRFNIITGNTNSWIAADPLFVAGNGLNSVTRSNAFIIYKNGNAYIQGSLGIGTTSMGQKLDIIAGNGRVESGYSWLTNSDVRFKKNINTLEGCLAKVMTMHGVSFNLISDSLNIGTGRKNIGFIAQELENVIPEVVVTGADGFKSVAYDKITAVLTEAIKEQQKQIESYKSQLQSLQEKVDRIEAMLAKGGGN